MNLSVEPSHLMLLGASPVMRLLREQLQTLAPVPFTVRIEGERGTGKGVAARLLHDWSPRCAGPFISQPLTLLAPGFEFARLVGWTRGAYTGATGESAGAFESAHAGTLLLDEIVHANAQSQGALLQLVEDGVVSRLGERRPRHVNVRLVVATNANLAAAVRAGAFRDDLLDRLGSLIVRMPALREHPEDMPELAAHALALAARRIERDPPALSGAELAALARASWPGNVRDLENAMIHKVVYDRLPDYLSLGAMAEHWRDRFPEVLANHQGNKSAAARELGISRQTLHAELRSRTAPV
ncbi:MAG TPA: sigma 54-interacting transcriptional regulator [Gemmatimonadales bacterium]